MRINFNHISELKGFSAKNKSAVTGTMVLSVSFPKPAKLYILLMPTH
ncbi:hypothetical protein [Pseudoalteromonas luteoviolacea]|nr:hypothetical protein [Pseudoalteromonas luteoviolacea]